MLQRQGKKSHCTILLITDGEPEGRASRVRALGKAIQAGGTVLAVAKLGKASDVVLRSTVSGAGTPEASYIKITSFDEALNS